MGKMEEIIGEIKDKEPKMEENDLNKKLNVKRLSSKEL